MHDPMIAPVTCGGSAPNAGETMEQRRARTQATVDAIFAPPHPEEFRSTYFRFWGGGS